MRNFVAKITAKNRLSSLWCALKDTFLMSIVSVVCYIPYGMIVHSRGKIVFQDYVVLGTAIVLLLMVFGKAYKHYIMMIKLDQIDKFNFDEM